jgi:hypothetical protein
MPALPRPPSAPHRLDPAALPAGPLQDDLRRALRQQRLADAHGHPLLRCEALTLTARSLAAARAWDASETCLALALQAARQLLASEDLQADLLCALAEVCCKAADAWDATWRHDDDGPAVPGPRHPARDRAHGWAGQAARQAARVSDTAWQVTVLLRAAEVLERGGELDEAVCLQRQALALEKPRTPSRWTRADPALRHARPRQPT